MPNALLAAPKRKLVGQIDLGLARESFRLERERALDLRDVQVRFVFLTLANQDTHGIRIYACIPHEEACSFFLVSS